jgi:hypothetical protein
MPEKNPGSNQNRLVSYSGEPFFLVLRIAGFGRFGYRSILHGFGDLSFLTQRVSASGSRLLRMLGYTHRDEWPSEE